MSAWEKQIHDDAEAVYALLVAEYAAGHKRPLSIPALATRTRRSRDRVNAALGDLVRMQKTVGVVGESADQPQFYPLSD
jgi:hypothetical protein